MELHSVQIHVEGSGCPPGTYTKTIFPPSKLSVPILRKVSDARSSNRRWCYLSQLHSVQRRRGPGLPIGPNEKKSVVKFDLYYPLGSEDGVWTMAGDDGSENPPVLDEGIEGEIYTNYDILDGWDNGKGKCSLTRGAPNQAKIPRSVLASKKYTTRKSNLAKDLSAGVRSGATTLKLPAAKAGTKVSYIVTTGVWVDNTNKPAGHGIATLKTVRSLLKLARIT